MIRFRLLGLSAGICLTAHWAYAVTDITFFSVSDTHYGQSSAAKDAGRIATVDILNGLPGRNYPITVGGGPVAAPRGVTIPGDLIEYPDTVLWRDYTSDYSPTGKARMKFPVYDGMGNHDFSNYNTNTTSLIIKNLFIQRNGLRARTVQTDSQNYHYSWDWDQVHFVQLNLYGGSAGAQGVGNAYKAYEFLQADLRKYVGASGRPVLVMEHFPMDTADDWWLPADKDKLATLLKDYNCIGILHGHSHQKKMYTYKGLDVFDDGTAMNSDVMVFHITDGRMVVVNRIGNAWGTLKREKAITMGSPATALSGSGAARTEPGSFVFGIPGLGRIYAGNRRATRVEIRTPSGRLLRNMRVTGGELAWDRRDEAGNPVPPGVYLARIATDAGEIPVKVALP